MTGFLYFQPNKTLVPDLTELQYAFEGAPTATQIPRPVSPSDTPGVLFANKTVKTSQIRYHKNLQRWRKIPGMKVETWIGVYEKDVPGPADLARSKQISGKRLKLSDGNDWVIPIVRDEANGTQLPLYMDLDENGEWNASGMTQDHNLLWIRVMEFMQLAIQQMSDRTGEDSEQKVSFQFDDLMPATTHCMRSNYRVSDIEIAMLRLLDNHNSACDILCIACDWEEFIARLGQEQDSKKNDSETESTGNTKGGNDTSPRTIGQPVLT